MASAQIAASTAMLMSVPPRGRGQVTDQTHLS